MCQSAVNQTVCGSVHVTVLFSISSLVSLSFCSVHQDDPQRLHRSSIHVLDPISDQFYEEAWMFTSARYTSIYQKVSVLLCTQINILLLKIHFHI